MRGRRAGEWTGEMTSGRIPWASRPNVVGATACATVPPYNDVFVAMVAMCVYVHVF